MMHGIGAAANSMNPVITWTQKAMPGVYIKNIEIGDGYLDSFFLNMDEQLASFCAQVLNDSQLQQGFNLIGYSQGGLTSRGFIQRCNSKHLVHNFITWSAPHGGVFGVPDINSTFISDLVAAHPYWEWVQEHVSFSNYWRDPYQLAEYEKLAALLPDLNNDNSINETYKDGILSLANFVMLYSTVDTIVKPKQSGWFSTYANGSQEIVVPLQQQPLWIEDRLGLQQLNNTGRLHFFSVACPHQDYPTDQCEQFFNEYTLPWLQNYL